MAGTTGLIEYSRDTVAAIGLPARHLPMFDEAGIRYVRHAVALDERRRKFRPHYCYDPSTRDDTLSRHNPPVHVVDKLKLDSGSLVDVEEVWFAGVHSGMSSNEAHI